MIEIEIPKDINKYEAKLVGPFTTRQTGCFVAACALAIPAFLALKEVAPRDLASMVVLIICLPFVLFGWVKPYGMTFEQFIKSAFISHVLAPKKRKYVTINAAEYLINETFSYEDIIKQSRMMTPKEKQKEEKRKINTDIKYYN